MSRYDFYMSFQFAIHKINIITMYGLCVELLLAPGRGSEN